MSGEVVGLALLNSFALQPVVMQQTFTLQVSGFTLLLILLALGAYSGYQQGLRNILTIALWSIVAYILCVQGGDIVVGILNRFWSNGPRLVAFLVGNDPNTVPRLDPLITPDFQVPLFFRFIAFISLILVGWFFNRKATWKGPPKEVLARPLGAFVGALIALLWTNALVVFWNQFQAGGGGFGGPVATILDLLPDVSILMPSLITVFFMILIILIAFNFPKVWKP